MCLDTEARLVVYGVLISCNRQTLGTIDRYLGPKANNVMMLMG